MRNPRVVLDNLSSKAKEKDYQFERIYRNLYNPEFYYMAYYKLYAKEGNMTEGVDGKTIDGMSVQRIEKLIETLKDQSYKPNPVRRTYIPKSNGGRRPLGIPSFEDKLVQEVVRSILEAVYENRFSNNSHGFRPNRSCHTALNQCKRRFNGVRWFVEGDIKSFFDHIDHHILINILRRSIKDERFINLIWKFLRAGYVEDWKFHKTYSGTPQGGIISPILANIYLNELDQYMEKYKEQFDKGIRRRVTKEYGKLHARTMKFRKKYKEIWHELTDHEKREIAKEYKRIAREKHKVPMTDPMDENFKRIQYVRYADDFIIGVIGSKQDAMKIKEDLTTFLKQHLKLELSQEKTLITHSSKKARFLSYDITVKRSCDVKKTAAGCLSRTNNGKCHLLLSKEIWLKKLIDLDALKITEDNKWKPKHRTYLKDHDDLEILSIYNAEIRGIYNYFKLATNVSVLKNFRFIMEYSMYKTFATKYKTTVGKIIDKYNVNGNFGVRYKTRNGIKVRSLYNEGFRRVKELKLVDSEVDRLPNTWEYNTRGSLIDRLRAEKCEWCGTENVAIQMHHVRKLKDVSGKKQWEQFMIARRRKTLALCKRCHWDLHAGRLD